MASGILLLDKPSGLSSNAALQRVRALYGRVKGGHVGSLDPLATGMLPVCLGEATKIAGAIVESRKRYRFTIALGEATATGDAEGEVCERTAVPPLEQASVLGVLEGFRGRGSQVPPMYSALKREGRPLYALARAGVTVERAARAIELFDLPLVSLGPRSLELEALCSKGTYIRVLAEDIARALGTCGHVTALRRLYVEPFEHEPMHTLESLREALPQLLPADAPLAHLPAVHLAAEPTARLLKGQRVDGGLPESHPRVRIYDSDGAFLGLGSSEASGLVQPRRLLNIS
jgi:tRNA pseudouridine55 synthase